MLVTYPANVPQPDRSPSLLELPAGRDGVIPVPFFEGGSVSPAPVRVPSSCLVVCLKEHIDPKVARPHALASSPGTY
jgi:hypothetical protein